MSLFLFPLFFFFSFLSLSPLFFFFWRIQGGGAGPAGAPPLDPRLGGAVPPLGGTTPLSRTRTFCALSLSLSLKIINTFKKWDGSYSIEIYVDQAVIGLLVKTTFSLFWSKLSSLNQGYSANMTLVSLNFRIVENNTSSKCRVFRLNFLWKDFPAYTYVIMEGN